MHFTVVVGRLLVVTMGELLKSLFLETYLPGTPDGPFPATSCGIADVVWSFFSCISGLLLLSSGDDGSGMGCIIGVGGLTVH